MTALNNKIIETLDLPPLEDTEIEAAKQEKEDEEQQTAVALNEANQILDKIDSALPQVKELEDSDQEFDELAELAKDKFHDLMDLGMSVEPKYAKDIFNAATNLLGHSITAKTNKIEKKLRMVELQIKKQRADQAGQKTESPTELPESEYQVIDRNTLFDKVLEAAKKKP